MVNEQRLIRAIIPSTKFNNIINGLTYYTTGMSGVSALRNSNPDKTDAEMFCLIGAGAAQLKSDNFNVPKYIENVLNGNWGDNEGDSKMISDGFNDYYAANGIDKAQIIKEERKIQ